MRDWEVHGSCDQREQSYNDLYSFEVNRETSGSNVPKSFHNCMYISYTPIKKIKVHSSVDISKAFLYHEVSRGKNRGAKIEVWPARPGLSNATRDKQDALK